MVTYTLDNGVVVQMHWSDLLGWVTVPDSEQGCI